MGLWFCIQTFYLLPRHMTSLSRIAHNINKYKTSRPSPDYHVLGDQRGMALTSVAARVVTRYCPLRDDVHCKGESRCNKVAAGFGNHAYARALGEVSVQSWCQLVTDLCTKNTNMRHKPTNQ